MVYLWAIISLEKVFVYSIATSTYTSLVHHDLQPIMEFRIWESDDSYPVI
jgi:hypothetical protein